MSMNKKFLVSFADLSDNSDENIKLDLFKAVLTSTGINYSVSKKPIERIEYNDITFWHARYITIKDDESFHAVLDYYKKDNPFSGFPGFLMTGDIVSFFVKNRKKIVNHLQTYHYYVESDSFFHVLEDSKYLKKDGSILCYDDFIFNVLYNDWTEDDIYEQNDRELYTDIITAIVWELCDSVLYCLNLGMQE